MRIKTHSDFRPNGPPPRLGLKAASPGVAGADEDCNSNTSLTGSQHSHDDIDAHCDNSGYLWFLDYNPIFRDGSCHHTSVLSSVSASYKGISDLTSRFEFTSRYNDIARDLDANLAEADMESFRTEDIHALLMTANLPHDTIINDRTHDIETSKPSADTQLNSTLLDSNNEMCTMMTESADYNADTATAVSVKPTMAEIAKNGEWKSQNKPSQEWITVQKRKSKNRFEGNTGKATTDLDEKFKAADIKIPLFISNVNKETSENDICQYIKNKTSETVTLEKMKMKKERPYNAFKVFVSKTQLDKFLDDKLWPDGISFRRYIYFKNRTEGKNDSPRSIEIRK